MKRFYLDTSVLITLMEIGQASNLGSLEGDVFVPDAVLDELLSDRDLTRLAELSDNDIVEFGSPENVCENGREEMLRRAAVHLGQDLRSDSDIDGDVALLSLGMADDFGVIVTDDKPLRKSCMALGIPVSGSIGVLIAAVERGELESDQAKDALVAMDEVGARLSARLLRRAEQLIDEAADREMGPNESG